MAKRGILVLVMMGLACTISLATPYPITVDSFEDMFPANPRLGDLPILEVNDPSGGFPFPPTLPLPPFSKTDWAYQNVLTGAYPHPGSRDAILTCGEGGNPTVARGANVSILNSELSYSNDQGVKSTLDLMYGNYTQGGKALDIGANWGYDPGKVFFYFTLLLCDQDGFVSMEFNTHSEGDADTFQALNVPMAEVPDGGPGVVQYIPLSLFKSLSAPYDAPTFADIDDIDGIAYRFYSTHTAWDMDIADLGLTIPEPATMTLLGLGLLALARRRRKS